MIEVRGDNVFKGYWRLPDKTSEELRDDGFFITGDLGVIDELGYVSIVGRAKDLIICGGFNVYPAEVEALLDAVPGVVESAVIGVPHPDMGEGVFAVVQRDGSGVDEAGVLAASDGRSHVSNSRGALFSWRNCRATRWARSRRSNCAKHMLAFSRPRRWRDDDDRTSRLAGHGHHRGVDAHDL